MLVVGLTGGIASGKSTVSNFLKNLGATIIDADIIAREIVEPGEKAWEEIRAFFPDTVINKDLTLNRKELGRIVFNDPEKRKLLNKITHPQIINKTKELIAKYKTDPNIPLIVVDAPLLIETGMEKMVDEVWVIDVKPEVQLRRLIDRDGISQEEAEKRINSQMSTQEKLKYADRVINGNLPLEEMLMEVGKIWDIVVEN